MSMHQRTILMLSALALLVVASFALAVSGASAVEGGRGSDAQTHSEQRQTLTSLLEQMSSMTGEDNTDEVERMRSMMTDKAKSVISSHVNLGLSDVDALMEGKLESFHPSTMSNVTFAVDLFESGNVLPVSDTNGDGHITVDDLLATFFHASNLESYFHAVEHQVQTPLAKGEKKQVIKHKTPTLHHTIKKITSHRGWGIQDARFCQPTEELEDGDPFKDYTTFVRTLREALMTPDST